MSGLKQKLAPTIEELSASVQLPEVHELETKQPTVSLSAVEDVAQIS